MRIKETELLFAFLNIQLMTSYDRPTFYDNEGNQKTKIKM